MCIYIYIYIYTRTHTHTLMHTSVPGVHTSVPGGFRVNAPPGGGSSLSLAWGGQEAGPVLSLSLLSLSLLLLHQIVLHNGIHYVHYCYAAPPGHDLGGAAYQYK